MKTKIRNILYTVCISALFVFGMIIPERVDLTRWIIAFLSFFSICKLWQIK